MYKLLSKLVIYKNISSECILSRLAEIFEDYELGKSNEEDTVSSIYSQINRLLDIATEYGFNDNLWHNYLAYLIATVETPFSMTCEKSGANEGTVNVFAKNDFKIFKQLFDYDFTVIEKKLDINCFSVIENYVSVPKKERSYNKSVSEKVRKLSRDIEHAADENEIFDIVTAFYRDYGVGMFGLNKAFRLQKNSTGAIRPDADYMNGTKSNITLIPITNTENVMLSDLVGYELQKQKLVENTEAFVDGKKANNCLLYGDAGTGKSTSIKAILNEYYDRGLRMIEIYKHQFEDLSTVISMIKNRNYKFIIYMDDLSFEEFEIEYKYLKAVIEGGLETKPDNVLIYATSNRRHLIRETWSDRSDMSDDEMHRSDTVQEKLSLVARFGVSINYCAPTEQEYFHIVKMIAERYPQIRLPEDELIRQARIWEMHNGGLSGRAASQFVTHLLGTV